MIGIIISLSVATGIALACIYLLTRFETGSPCITCGEDDCPGCGPI